MTREWVTISEYGRVYGLSRSKVYEFLACGILRTWEAQGVRRILNKPPDDPGHVIVVVRPPLSTTAAHL